jgi:hypothetical protein
VPEQGTLLSALSPPDGEPDGFRENLRVHSSPVEGRPSIDDLFAQNLERVSTEGKLTVEGQGTLPCNGHRVRWMALVQKQTPAGGLPLTMLEYALVYRGQAYSLKFMVETKKYASYLPVFEGILKSVEPRASREEREMSEAYGQGAAVSRIVVWVIVAVLVLYGAGALLRTLKKGAPPKAAP